MLNQSLCDFITSVPGCLETNVITIVLNLFQEHNCNCVVICNEQRAPIGIIYAVRLIPRLINIADKSHLEAETKNCKEEILDLQQPISSLGQDLIEPITTLSSDFNLEQLSTLIPTVNKVAHNYLDWALIDGDGRFLGLLDTVRLLQFVLKQQITWDETETGQTRAPTNLEEKALIKLLERLPWPLMLQTCTGEIIMQNPTWWQKLGNIKNPEIIRQQITGILRQSEYLSTREKQHFPISDKAIVENLSYKGTASAAPKCKPITTNTTTGKSLPDELITADSTHRCFWDYQLGTCICVIAMADKQERIWQFAKIPLDIIQTGGQLNNKSSHSDNYLWLVLATDVTEQKQLCQELATKNVDLIQLNRLKDEFLACISHELKTPLTAVLGLSRLLADQQLGQLNERQARYTSLIHQSGQHLMGMVNDILDLTRMEIGQMELTLVPVNIPRVCDRAYNEANTLHNQNNKSKNSSILKANDQEHKFTLTIETDLQQIIADELRLQQMLVHLISNALKFTETSGEIGLTVNYWEGWITFTVWDTGIGIPEHQQHLIFQKFQQLENPLIRQFEGTGLGLVLTRTLARLHGGDVSFLSIEGQGSKFTLLLPYCPSKKEFGEAYSQNRNQLKNSSCLNEGDLNNGLAAPNIKNSLDNSFWENRRPLKNHLIDSAPTTLNYHQDMGSPEVAMMSVGNFPHKTKTKTHKLVLVVEAVAQYIEDITGKLNSLNYRVTIARSGTEALEKARRLQPQVIFLNPFLPLLSGWDVLTLIKSDRNIRQIPVIITATAAEKEQALTNFANGFVSIPVQKQLLAQLLE